MMFSRPIHLPANFKMSVFFSAVLYSVVKMHHIFFIHSSVEEHLGCFQFLAVIKNAARNTIEHISLWYDLAVFGYTTKSDIAGS